MRILITAGPTREFFDSVRFISNPSSGKMGYAIAAQALGRGHEVVLISGPVDLHEPPGAQLIRVVSAEEMFKASIAHFETCQCAVMTAAVCDYRPTSRLKHKLKKQNQPRTIQLEPTDDILANLAGVKGKRVVIGFAMEDHDHHAHAEQKLRRKQCDAIVLNGMSNVASDNATVEILRTGGAWSAPCEGSKGQIASIIVDLVEELASSNT